MRVKDKVYKLEYMGEAHYEMREFIYLGPFRAEGFSIIKLPGDTDEAWDIEYTNKLFDLKASAIRAEIDNLHQERKLINKKLKALWSMPDAF